MSAKISIHAGLYSRDRKTDEAAYFNRGRLLDILRSRHGDGFSLQDVLGYWNGQEEPGVIVQIINPAPLNAGFLASVEETARQYKAATNQKEVWITVDEPNLVVV